ncbi:DUF4260 domain-containing protein [Gramella sp. AN32]|uniref:DUF4260 domain-containing protein n=1 Tax=Christiangramia antarctica TaxID=2058158 RepID=A0ABW5XBA4_9FLAO|nr:DUF4260 domain-containing protein [Gramella sp. AN32]MCM4155446.1 DUF4260 domain-containing protein [Gramella sp. AN32]
MKTILKLEEFGLLLFGIWAFSNLDLSWGWYVGLFLVPDIGMLGYLLNKKYGAILYNIFHHRFIAVILFFIGYFIQNEFVMMAGIILFSHIAFDRMLGYGLKFEKGFKFTHLGEIGN